MRALSNTPIFRRLFIAFTIATVIPGVVIASLGIYYLNSLTTRGQAVKNSFDAQNTAFEEQINLNRMNAVLNTRFAEVFANKALALSGNPDALAIDKQAMNNNDCFSKTCYISLDANGRLSKNEILTREFEFDQTVHLYQQNFQVATSDNMSVVVVILLNADPNNGTITGEQQPSTPKAWQDD